MATDTEQLLYLENMHKIMDMYMWLATAFGMEMFPSYAQVSQLRTECAKVISQSLALNWQLSAPKADEQEESEEDEDTEEDAAPWKRRRDHRRGFPGNRNSGPDRMSFPENDETLAPPRHLLPPPRASLPADDSPQSLLPPVIVVGSRDSLRGENADVPPPFISASPGFSAAPVSSLGIISNSEHDGSQLREEDAGQVPPPVRDISTPGAHAHQDGPASRASPLGDLSSNSDHQVGSSADNARLSSQYHRRSSLLFPPPRSRHRIFNSRSASPATGSVATDSETDDDCDGAVATFANKS